MASDTFHDPLTLEHLLGHVKDSTDFHLPRAFGEHIHIPQPFAGMAEKPIFEGSKLPAPLNEFIEPWNFQITRFMVLEVVVSIIIVALFAMLAGKVKSGVPKGKFWNLLEVFLVFIRDEIARPTIGKHDADRFLPYLWTIFFFVLGCNLIGMVPWMGSPTGAFATTGTLAFITFGVVLVSGMKALGAVGFWKAQVPHMDLPGPMAILIKPMVFAIEVLGLFIKHFVLAVRLLANMVAGHLVLGVLTAFVAAICYYSSSYVIAVPVSFVSVLGATGLSLLELFVAFLQAYIFTFLSALFIGSAVHPH
ncbi:MAG: F0F1 ATP synthase subunit A [Planctomycetales bacterium]|nr:F0F1 ATP synthase subunit A [Planctomycetales bacterium]